MKDKILYAICFGFILGVFIASFFLINVYTNFFLALTSAALLLIFSFIYKSKWGIIFSVFIISISLGIFRFGIASQSEKLIFDNNMGSTVNLQGIVIDSPTLSEYNQKLKVKIKQEKEKVGILIITNLNQDFRYGDEISFKGKIEKPKNFFTDQGKIFDYINYLKKDGIYYVVRYPEIKIISQNNGSFLKRALFSVKDKFLEKINKNIASPESLLMAGLILGERSAFDEKLREDFIRTGTIHIVALSGYNVTIVAECFMRIFSFLPFTFSIGAGIIAIFLFVIMTGGASTAVRAGIMAVLVLIARATGRTYDVARALLLAAVLMIIFNPYMLAFDVSFQLSFIATIAVIFFTPKIEKYFKWVTTKFGLRDIISITFSAYVFVLPFILYKMGNLSLVALPANILVLPFIPLTMMLGFITGFLGIIFDALSIPFGIMSYLFLHYELSTIRFFSEFSFASFSVPNFPIIITILIYIYFIYLLFGRNISLFFKSI